MTKTKPVLVKKEGVTIAVFNDTQLLLDFLGYSKKTKFFRDGKNSKNWKGKEMYYTLEYQTANPKTVKGDLEKKREEKKVWYCKKHKVYIAINTECPLCVEDSKRGR